MLKVLFKNYIKFIENYNNFLLGMMQDPESGLVFIAGGWDASSSFKITKMHIPADLCHLFSKSKYLCRHFVGCSFCTVSESNNEKKTNCFTNGQPSSFCEAPVGFLSYNHGTVCDEPWNLSKQNCSSFTSCSSCVSSWPAHENSTACKWCNAEECEVVGGKCIAANTECNKENPCEKSVELTEHCPEVSCGASNCENCMALTGCSWTYNKHSKVVKCLSTEIAVQKNLDIYNACTPKCEEYGSCTSCLNKTRHVHHELCHWSSSLNKCISPAYHPLYCVGGLCGLMLTSGDTFECSDSCESYGQCDKCLENAHCGWCSANGLDGQGVCIRGSLELSSNDTCSVNYAMQKNVSVESLNLNFTWNYMNCPKENECLNG